jgi:hypothetical protein
MNKSHTYIHTSYIQTNKQIKTNTPDRLHRERVEIWSSIVMRWNDDNDEAETDVTEMTTPTPRSHNSSASHNSFASNASYKVMTARLTTSSGVSRGIGGSGGGKEAAARVSACLLEYEGGSCDHSIPFRVSLSCMVVALNSCREMVSCKICRSDATITSRFRLVYIQ